MAAEISTQKYDPAKLDLLKRLLEKQAQRGTEQALFYEIIVDEIKVVLKTNDPKEFDSYEEHVNEDTQKIKVVIYYSPNSPRNRTHIFILKEPTPPNTLSGVDIDARINEKVSAERERWENLQVKNELDVTKKKLGEAEEYIDTLQTELEKFKGKKLHIGDVNLGELASVVVEGIIRRNPRIIAKIPGGAALAGVIEQDNKEQENGSGENTETEASFQRKSETDVTPTEDEQKYFQVIRQMEEQLGQEQLLKVMQIIESLTNEPKNITTVAELLNIKTEKKNEKV